MPWTDAYQFDNPFEDVRDDPSALIFASELEREVGPGHPLFGRPLSVVARAWPQDDVVVACGEDVALIHLTWTGRREAPPWPVTTFLATAEALESCIEYRY